MYWSYDLIITDRIIGFSRFMIVRCTLLVIRQRAVVNSESNA